MLCIRSHQQHPAGPEAEVRVQQVPQRADEETSRQEQDERHRDLRRREAPPQTKAARPARRTVSALLELVV